jgi:DNA-binding CsgD family transcriptional regulator
MRARPPLTVVLCVVVGVQAVCALFFVVDIAAGLVGIERDPLSWEVRELLEIGAGLGLLLGVGLGAALLVRTLRSNRAMESRLRQLSGAFAELLDERFREWNLTPSERDVAWFTIKGLSIAEVARLRGTSEGTVKAHSAAIYRKAGVSGRTQLLSVFLDELMAETPAARQDAPEGPSPARSARGR